MKGILPAINLLILLPLAVLGQAQDIRPAARTPLGGSSKFYYENALRLKARQEGAGAAGKGAPKAAKGPPAPKASGAPPAAPKASAAPKAAAPPKAASGGTAPKASGAPAKGTSDFSDTAKALPNYSGTQGKELKKPKDGYGAAGGVYTGSWTPVREVVV